MAAHHIYQILYHPYFIASSIALPVTTYLLHSSFARRTKILPISKPHKCRFRLDDETSAQITLPDGRKLGYAQYGAPTGKPIFGMHGSPGSRLEFAFWDDIGKRHNARFIGVDRPGIGWSSPAKDRKVVDIAKDVQCLAEHLELEEYAVMGLSGGGPSALACAHSLPKDKLKSATVIVGVGVPGMSTKGIQLTHWLGYGLQGCSRAPWAVRWFLATTTESRTNDSDRWMDHMRNGLFGKGVNPINTELGKDLEWRDDMLTVCLGGMKEAFRNGVHAVADDMRAMTSDWGCKIEDINPNLPLQLWYGKHDTSVPPIIGTQIAERFRGKAELHIEDQTHLTVQWNCQEQIMKDLMRAFDKQ